MKYLFSVLMLVLLITAGCRKNACGNKVTITNQGTPCSEWAIKTGGHTYPSNNIPDAFKREGIIVCAKYELYEDLGMCACCGGTKATILSMSGLDE